MDNHFEQLVGNPKVDPELKTLKRKINEVTDIKYTKKLKDPKVKNSNSDIKIEAEEEKNEQKSSPKKYKTNGEAKSFESLTTVFNSPKKRLELSVPSDIPKSSRGKFIYGNYSQYYGYRNKGQNYSDKRLDVFAEYRHIFKNKHMLDIGCNSGFITMEVTKQFEVKSTIGLDIDKSLINQAFKNLTKLKKSLPMDNEFKTLHKFPFNITFVHGNYVLKDDVLLEIERAEFDVILCLSITKWIHLNFGDSGIKQAFRRMFLQLKPQGMLILEAQPYDNYGRRKKMTETIYNNFKEIKFYPKDFTDYLLSSEVGFSKVDLMGVPDHCEKGFKRPIHIFYKA